MDCNAKQIADKALPRQVRPPLSVTSEIWFCLSEIFEIGQLEIVRSSLEAAAVSPAAFLKSSVAARSQLNRKLASNLIQSLYETFTWNMLKSSGFAGDVLKLHSSFTWCETLAPTAWNMKQLRSTSCYLKCALHLLRRLYAPTAWPSITWNNKTNYNFFTLKHIWENIQNIKYENLVNWK